MAAASLDGVRMKLDLGRQDFAQLKAACDRFIRDDPNSAAGVRIEQDADAGVFTTTAVIPEDFPLEMGGLVGRILYALRSSLDNLAWQLVLANGGTPGKHTEFPVFEDEPEFKRRARRMMRGMSASAKTAIQELQPFNAWPEHPDHATLWKIHDLNNIDKHRLPYITCLYLSRSKGELRSEADIGGVLDYVRRKGPVENGAVLVRLRYDPARARTLNAKMEMQLEVAFDVAIQSTEVTFLKPNGEPSEAIPVHGVFETAFDYIDTTVLPAFAAEFS